MKPETVCKGWIDTNGDSSRRLQFERMGIVVGKWCEKDQRFENCRVPFGKIKALVDLGYKVNLKGPDGLAITGGPVSTSRESAYAVWDENLVHASDEPDGMPDLKIVELITTLRKRGVVTLQSCAGHEGTDDGCLWMRASSVSYRGMVLLSGDPFSRVYKTFWPDEMWVFEWNPAFWATAIARLMTIQEPEDPE